MTTYSSKTTQTATTILRRNVVKSNILRAMTEIKYGDKKSKGININILILTEVRSNEVV